LAVLLLFSAFGLIFCSVRKLRHEEDLRRVFLWAAVLWGSILTLGTEILSFFQAINFFSVFLFWALVNCIFLAVIKFSPPKRTLPSGEVKNNLDTSDVIWLFLTAFIAGLTAATAWWGPPNNWDSLVYHMSRVAHWIQNQTVAHYPTAIKTQIYYSPWPGFAILNFQILSGSDRFANFVQWFSMLGSLVGVSAIAKLLGGKLKSQIFAAFLTVTIPMGILQSATTQTDYVAAFWLICFVYFFVEGLKQAKFGYQAIASVGLSFGLALLSKGTVYLYALAFLAWLFIEKVKKERVHALIAVFYILGMAFLINAPHYARNLALAGHPLGELSVSAITRNEAMDPGLFFSNIVRNTALHLGTSFKGLNALMEDMIRELHTALHLNLTDERTSLGSSFEIPVTLHEDGAGNFCHLVLIVIALILWARTRRQDKPTFFYPLALLAGIVLFNLALKWQPFNSRLHLPLFVLFCPFVAVIFSRIRFKPAVILIVITATLFSSAMPYVFRNSVRKLYSKKKRTVFNTPRLEQYFANERKLLEPYRAAVDYVDALGCSQVGLIVSSNSWEYPLWVLFKEKGKTVRLEHLEVPGLQVNHYPLGDFSPCALIVSDREKPVWMKGWDEGRAFLPSLRVHARR